MRRPSLRRSSQPPDVRLPPAVAEAVRAILPHVGEDVVASIIAEVPSYQDALAGHMGETIRAAVRVALGGFLDVASGQVTGVQALPVQAQQGAYELGRGEARSGRTTEALLAAYRIGARVAWREMSSRAVAEGVAPQTLVEFAGLVFTYIDELSDASAAGHADELATTGRVRQRLLERLARLLLEGAAADVLDDAAVRADWSPPSSLTAALVPAAHVGPVLALVSPATLVVPDVGLRSAHHAGAEGEDEAADESHELTLLLVPDAHGKRRAALLRALTERTATVGPAKPWREARLSFERARRARLAGYGPDTEEHLVSLVLNADPDALADLRASVLAPLADLKPGSAEKLTETLRAWLLHQGRRDDVAAALFVHPQTVRYRVGQLRELYGDRLDDPATVLALTVALG